MLRFLREYKKNWLTKIIFSLLFLLLIAAFALWGISDVFFNPQQQVVVAKVGDGVIDSRDFLRHYRNQTREIAKLLGGRFTGERGRQLGFVDMTLSTLITRALFDNESRSMGLAVSDDQIRRAIYFNPDFQDDFGAFNELNFRRVLRDAGYSEDAFVNDLGQDLRRLQLTGTVKIALSAPDAIVRPLTLFRQESRIGQSILINPEEIAAPQDPGDAVLRAWFDQHKDDFQAPEYRALSYLAITPRLLAADIDIVDEDVRETYDARRDGYITPEKRRLLQILVPDEDRAKSAWERINNGDDFALVAKEIANQTEKDIDLEWNQREDMIDALEEDVFALPKGGMTKPISSPFGWHIVRVEDIQEQVTISFEEAAPAIRQALAMEGAIEAGYALSRKVEDGFAAGDTLADVTALIDLPLRTIARIDDKGRDDKGVEIAVPEKNRFLSQAFDLEKGKEHTALVETDRDGFFAIRVDDVTPARPLDFAEARPKVLEKWQENEKREKAEQQARDILKELGDGADFGQLAKRRGLQLSTSADFTRSTFLSQEIPAPLAEGLFNLSSVGESLMVTIPEGVIVARLTDIRDADLDSKSLVRSVQSTIEREVGDDLLDQYAKYLQRFYPISIEDRAIDDIL